MKGWRYEWVELLDPDVLAIIWELIQEDASRGEKVIDIDQDDLPGFE